MKRSSKLKNLLLVFLLAGLDALCGPVLLSVLKQRGYAIFSPGQILQHPAEVLLQTALISGFGLLLVPAFFLVLRKKFPEALALQVKTGQQRLWILGLLLLFTLTAGLAVRENGDPVTVLYEAFYYLMVVGFLEEFVFRGAAVFLLRGFSWQITYLLPSFLFAMIHIFAFAGFGPLTKEIAVQFMTARFFPLMASGCCMHLMKNRTGSLWVPVLLHGFLDFFSVCLQ